MGSIDVSQPDYDVLILGAGLSGVYASYRVRELGLTQKVLEMGSNVGGTWYWNRYPGARFDCELYTYGFSWSKELLEEWDWTEHFAPQGETERYVRYICDRFKLWDNMQFHTRVKSAHWDDDGGYWRLTDQHGRQYTSRFLITGIGLLSDPTLPNIKGVDSYKGPAFHTSAWPKEEVKFEGKRVGVIGVGATAIQAIPEIAKTAKHLSIFQRTPNWAIPLHNAPIDKEAMEKIRKGYPELFEKVDKNRMSFMHDPLDKSIWDATPEEREVLWEHLYAQPGFGFWVSNYKEILVDQKANDLVSEFVAKKVRQRVNDPKTAEKLIPKNHGFGTRRVPMETHYFEAYNKPNVELIDLLETPIEEITENGVKTTEGEYECDLLVYATGFSAITGSFDAIDFRGVGGARLIDKWSAGPRTFLGITTSQFPNMFMSIGPHQAYGNIPRSIEYAVGWIAECLGYLRDHNIKYMEATERGVQEWTDHVHDIGQGLLMNQIDSWMTGVNKNNPKQQKRIIARYCGAAQDFRKSCEAVSSAHYDQFTLA